VQKSQIISPLNDDVVNYTGFEGGTGTYLISTTDEVDIVINADLEVWQLNTKYDSSTGTGTCKTYDPLRIYFEADILTEDQFNACGSYIKNTY